MFNLLKEIPFVNQGALKYVVEHIKPKTGRNDLWLEFGVKSGRTVNYMASHTNNRPVYGFDSFEGLPEDWRNKYPKGKFTQDGILPPVRRNVELIKGWFDQTLEPFLSRVPGQMSLLHLDADLYSSTKYVLDTLTSHNRIKPGTVIVFDEIINFPEFDSDRSELKALYDWSIENEHIGWKWIGTGARQIKLKLTRSGHWDTLTNSEQAAALQITNLYSTIIK